tara:strand:- start:892 stop:1077 length:186 start_codon:yes stop_codon:yes gene_type:complete
MDAINAADAAVFKKFIMSSQTIVILIKAHKHAFTIPEVNGRATNRVEQEKNRILNNFEISA